MNVSQKLNEQRVYLETLTLQLTNCSKTDKNSHEIISELEFQIKQTNEIIQMLERTIKAK